MRGDLEYPLSIQRSLERGGGIVICYCALISEITYIKYEKKTRFFFLTAVYILFILIFIV